MAFFDNIAELKKHNSSLTSGLDLINLQSFIDDAINFQIIRTISFNQYNELLPLKASGTAKQKRVIDLLQKAVVGFLIANYSDNGALAITNAGINVAGSEKSRPASDKKLMQLKKANLKSAYSALEMAVEFLEENLSDFTQYASSQNHKDNRSGLINTSTEFQKAGVQICNDAQLYQNLRAYQLNMEETYILPIIGESIAENLYSKILSNTLTEAEGLLLKKIRKPLAAFTMAEAIPYKAVSIDSTGIFQLSETVGGISGNVENRNAATDRQLSAMMNSFQMRAEQDIELLRKFLKNNASAYNYTAPNEVLLNDGSSPNIYII